MSDRNFKPSQQQGSESVKCRFSAQIKKLEIIFKMGAASKLIQKALGLYFHSAAVQE